MNISKKKNINKIIIDCAKETQTKMLMYQQALNDILDIIPPNSKLQLTKEIKDIVTKALK